MKPRIGVEKPWSIMRRTASGSVSVVAAATTSEDEGADDHGRGSAAR